MLTINSLKPIYDNNSKILILGSLPSVTSRAYNFYYAHPHNRFWPILEVLFNESLKTKEEKINFLLNNHIAMWDTIKSCDIIASSDSSIKNVKVNDIKTLLSKTNIKWIFCIGKKSYELFNKYFKVSIEVIYLPSPSSANAAFSFSKLVNYYRQIKDVLTENT